MRNHFHTTAKVFASSLVVLIALTAVNHRLLSRGAVDAPAASDAESADARIDFKRDIQPIFRRNCYRCHGPNKKRGRLRLSRRDEALKRSKSAKPLVVTAHPEKSLLLKRLTDKSAGDVMPLDSEPLRADEIALLQRWIKAGAPWPDDASEDGHWAYVKPKRFALPAVKNKSWPANPIDHFILARLEEEGLTPAPPPERARLIRRVYLALTGLPPSVAEVDAFITDDSPRAYAKVVEGLLRSPQYGEFWARQWLDLARYADTNGYQADQIRDSWAYRDWVIKAINNDMPFDQFTIEQLAGDLLPNATVDQKIATGFHRTVTCNVEAGVHPEANRVNQIFDRVSTTATVFLGTTMECAQCHDHKYDPFTQKDYYRLFAYFNNTPLEVAGKGGVQFDFAGPAMNLPLGAMQQARYDELQQELNRLTDQQKQVQKKQLAEFTAWSKRVTEALENNPAKWRLLPITNYESTGGEDLTLLKDGSLLAGGSVPGTAIYTLRFQRPMEKIIGFKIETLTHESLPGSGPGRGDAERTNFILSEFTAEIHDRKDQKREEISLHSARADFSQKKWDVSGAIDGNRKTGWAIAPQFHKPHWATFRTHKPVSLKDDETLVLHLDQNYGRGRTIGRVRISALNGSELTADLPADVAAILKKNNKQRKAKERKRLQDFFASSNPEVLRLKRAAQKLRQEMKKLQPVTTLVMVEKNKARETHLLNRGNYLDKGEKVSPGTPESLHPIDPSLPKNRLGLAKWLVARDNPLVARVTVNRWWTELFGRGLVATPEDFGTQSELPTHPKLLDWLAVEFMDKGWSMKHIHKLMVMSAAFRQSARLSPMLRQRDPSNRLYARGPRFRLSAEAIRDNALAVSGLLSKKMYGPPIMPYQPTGVWKAVGRNQPKWIAAKDEDRFRRGLYVVWKRSAPYPSFVNFDAPDRASCTVKRPRTNTPLQALTLLNDPAYAEMALALAQRMMSESADKSPAKIAARGFRLCVARTPSERVVNVLVNLYESEHHRLKENPKLVQQRLQNLLPRLRNSELNQTEIAAWFAVANALLNMDETINN